MADRRSLLLVALILILAASVRFGAFQANREIRTDTGPFLDVVRLMNGTYRGSLAPFRIEYPLYAYTVASTQPFVSDPVVAAQIASFVPSLATVAMVFWIVRLVGGTIWAAALASAFTAVDRALIRSGTQSVYDSLFVFMTVALVAAAFMLMRRPTTWTAIASGAVAGLAWATRGPGAFFPFVCVTAILTTRLPRKTKASLSLAVVAIAIGTCWLARLPVRLLAADLPHDPTNCLKAVLLDGQLYSRGDVERDRVASQLNPSCTEFSLKEARVCEVPWPEFLKQHGRGQIISYARNMLRLLQGEPQILPWFIWIPITFGALWLARKSSRVSTLLALTAFPFLLVIPGMQLQPSYFLAVVPLAYILAGLGVAPLADSRWGRVAVAAIFIACLAVGALPEVKRLISPDSVPSNYRQAALWPGLKNERAMARYRGVDAYLTTPSGGLPVNDLGCIATYGQRNGIRYLIAGPWELGLNPHLAKPHPAIREVGRWGSGTDLVRLFRID